LQLLSNLLTNAVKFCRPGDTITLGAEPRHGEVWIFVRDTGPGIEAQDLPHVFEIYWKTDRDPGSGTGLGLSIARGIVQAHGGHIWVESETGAGTVFTFTLPEEP
jgi:signal transduction histidine kinase